MTRARFRSRLTHSDVGEVPLTVWPWDLDIYPETNNGRQLTLMDLGRFDFGARVGLMRVLRERRWGLVVGGSTIQYRRRLRPFARFTLRTELVGRDEKWFYFVQTTVRKGVPHSQALVRTAVIAGPRGTVPTQEVLDAIGEPNWRPDLPDWALAWIAADQLRPWPKKID